MEDADYFIHQTKTRKSTNIRQARRSARQPEELEAAEFIPTRM